MTGSSPLIGAIDQGTSSTRFMVFEAGSGRVVAEHQVEVEQLFPHEGWVEQRPEELLSSVQECIQHVSGQLEESGAGLSHIAALGITNQRETSIVWDRRTGAALNNAVVWCDARNGVEVGKLSQEHGKDHLRPKCGLPLATYFSATKLSWLLDNVAEVREAGDNLMFGTVDTWLVWNLTGGVNDGQHVTDVTNASRTMLMNISTLDWDDSILEFFNVDKSWLPTIQASSSDFGTIAEGPLAGVKILGVVGDQQAALLGQGCVNKGEAKNTYGTGCFMLYNTGHDIVQSRHGLLTTVAYQQEGDQPTYALEGSVAVAGLALRWLRDNMGMISDYSEAFELASQVERTDGVYFVPAFSGLFAPHWRSDARGTLCGLTGHTTKQHVSRAVIESVCFQVCEIFEAMKKDSGSEPKKFLVDGGMTQSDVLLQLQSNLLGVEVHKPAIKELTALGAAVAAGVTAGVWDLGSKIKDIRTFSPQIDGKERARKMNRWKMALERSLGWDLEAMSTLDSSLEDSNSEAM